MNIRPAVADDVPGMRRIVEAAYAKYIAVIGKPPGPMLDDYAARVDAHEAWVADDDGSVLGLIVLVAQQDCMLLDNVAVDPSAQGRGVGRMLMDFAEREAERRGYREMRLYTHEKMTANLSMYPALGWIETGRRRDAGYDRVFFRKAVDQRWQR